MPGRAGLDGGEAHGLELRAGEGGGQPARDAPLDAQDRRIGIVREAGARQSGQTEGKNDDEAA